MKNPIRALICVLCLVLIILISDAAIFNYMFIPEPYYGRDVYAVSDFSGVDVFGYIEETKIYTAVIHYPKMKTDNLNRIVLDYASRLRQEFIDELKFHDKDELAERRAHFNLSFEIIPFGEKLYSFIFTVDRYFNNINNDKKTDIFLVDTHRLGWVKQLDVIDGSEENRQRIFDLMLKELKKRDNFEGAYFPETLKDKILSSTYDFNNMYFTQNEVVFLFDKYEIASGNAGTVEIRLPKAVAVNMFTQKWQERLEFEAVKEERYFHYEDAYYDDTGLSKKKAALIFTGGPDLLTTPDILDVLSEYDVTATFFVIGQRAVFYPGIIREIVSRGHEIGNFTYGYKDLSILPLNGVLEDLEMTNSIIKDVCGVTIRTFAPPFGTFESEIEEMTLINWNKDFDGNINDIEGNAVIRFHDVNVKTADDIIPVIERLRYLGYRFVGVSSIY